MSPYYIHMLVAATISCGFLLINDVVKAFIEKPWWKNILATMVIVMPIAFILSKILPKNLDHVETSSATIGVFLGLALSELIQFLWRRSTK